MSPARGYRVLGVLAGGAALALALGACGGGSASASKTTPTTSRPNGAGTRAGSRFPGATGTVAAINGSSMEVQNPQSGQVTVSWTSSTTFSKTVTVAESSIKAGDCVTATGSTATGTLVATSVTISQPDSSGSCSRAGGAGGFAGGGPGGFARGGGGTPPSSIPNRTLPPGAANFGIATGKVTSVSPGSLVIYGISVSGFGRRAGASAGTTTPTTVPATNVTVDVSSATTYSETQPAAAGDLAVNDCVTATGTADDTGAITARDIRITPMGPNGCTAGFGRGGFPGNGAVAANG